MRITIDEERGGLLVDPHTPVTIILDGVKQKHCICADDELGEVVRLKLDERGYAVTKNDSVEFETVKGNVTILFG